MTKQQITIEVDVPEGWEFVRYGMPKAGEHWLDGVSAVHCAGFDYQDTGCIIVQKAWQWPAWLKYSWLAMDRNERWWAYENEPNVFDRDIWYAGGDRFEVSHKAIEFTPPPCTDWRQSKRRRPT